MFSTFRPISNPITGLEKQGDKNTVLKTRLIFKQSELEDTADILLNHLRVNIRYRKDVERFTIVKCKDIDDLKSEVLEVMTEKFGEVKEKLDRLMILLES